MSTRTSTISEDGGYPRRLTVQAYHGHIRAQSVGMQSATGSPIAWRSPSEFPSSRASTKAASVTTRATTSMGSRRTRNTSTTGNTTARFRTSPSGFATRPSTGRSPSTPFAAAVIPSHSYTYFAHSAAGKDLHEYLLGLSVGSRLDRIVAGSYIEATYSYAFVEKVLGIYHNRSDFFVELGYFLTPSLSLRGVGTGTYTHGGLIFKDSNEDLPPEVSYPSRPDLTLRGDPPGGRSHIRADW